MNKNLIIRSDADTRMGTGHIMRCIALAQTWQDNGGDVTFLSHCESPPLRQRILDEGFDFIPIEKPYPDHSDLGKTLDQLCGSPIYYNSTARCAQDAKYAKKDIVTTVAALTIRLAPKNP